MSKASESWTQPRSLRKLRLARKGFTGYQCWHLRSCSKAYDYGTVLVRKERDWRKRETPSFRGDAAVPRDHVVESIRQFLEALDSPRALTVWLLFRSDEDHSQVVSLTCSPDDYADEASFGSAFAATSLLRKCIGLNTGINTEEVAVTSAAKAEVKNRETNLFFRLKRMGLVTGLLDDQLDRARSKIAEILGDPPVAGVLFDDGISQETIDHHYEELKDLGQPRDKGWSNGRTTSASGDHLSQVRKYLSTCDVTPAARSHASALVANSSLWSELVDSLGGLRSRGVRGAVMLVVPKNASTGRVICYEPHMNIRLQLAVGGYLRERLKLVGVNLDDQNVNRRRARFGSKWDRLATIDLSSASDTICRELIWELLPVEWACLLDDLRSHETLWPDGKWRTNEKFSSMGNGFTFELESLLFYAICSSVTHSVSVYGDDIILPTEGYSKAVKLLEYCGFSVNQKKSFASGNFRESCGMNAYLGNDVTPVYMKSLPETLREFVVLHNQFWAFATRKGENRTVLVGDTIFQGEFRKARPEIEVVCRWMRLALPFYTGPSGFGDGHYHTRFDDAWVWDASLEPESFGVEGWWFLTEITEYRDDWLGEGRHFCEQEGIAAILTATGPKRPESILDTTAYRRVTGYRSIRSLAYRWPAYLEV